MSVAIRAHGNGNGNSALATRASRDPFALARDLFSWDPFFGGRQVTAFSPAFEVKETQDAFVVKADLPGVDPKDVEVALEHGALTIKGEKKSEKETKEKNFHRVERFAGRFYRTIPLPAGRTGSLLAWA